MLLEDKLFWIYTLTIFLGAMILPYVFGVKKISNRFAIFVYFISLGIFGSWPLCQIAEFIVQPKMSLIVELFAFGIWHWVVVIGSILCIRFTIAYDREGVSVLFAEGDCFYDSIFL